MAHGVPVVTTSIGAEGLFLRDGVDAMIADTPEEFAQKVVSVYQDAQLWSTLSENGRARVRAEWSPDAVDATVTQILGAIREQRSDGSGERKRDGVEEQRASA